MTAKTSGPTLSLIVNHTRRGFVFLLENPATADIARKCIEMAAMGMAQRHEILAM